MKLHRLELTGFGPFRETQVVDFDVFDADGVFLISGRTGAGKSSILDGVSFALYGSVPRYDGSERRLRSDHCFIGDPTEVRLEFTVGDTRWRVTRAPEYERPAKRGGGVTLEPTRAELEELVDGAWIGRAAKPREVGLQLDEVLGLSAQQFQQVILLAQNKFSRFLLAKNDERQALLRSLFGTRRFEQYKDDLEQRRKDAQKRLETAGEHARTLLDLAERLVDEGGLGGEDERPADLPGRRDAATRALQRAEYRVEQAGIERQIADAAAAAAAAEHTALTARAKTLAEVAAARSRLAQLEADAPAIADDRVRLQRAQAADRLRAVIELAERAAVAHGSARIAADTAERAWIDAGGADDDDLAHIIDELTGDLAVWTAAAARERELADAEKQLASREAALADLTLQLVAIDEQRALVPAERERLEGQLTTARDVAVRLPDLRERHEALTVQLDAARDAVELASAMAVADTDYVLRNAEATASRDAVTALLQRRLAGFAGELSAQLEDGAPCAVCGSTAHPHPAEPSDDPVTDELFTQAEAAQDAATAAATAAGDAARIAREAHAAAVARAGGQSAEQLAAVVDECAEAVRTAEAAEADLHKLAAQLTELADLDAAAAAEREELLGRQVDERERSAALSATAEKLRAEVTAARGEFATVADRVAVAARRREVARTSVAAQVQLAERARSLAAASADRDERVAASVFDDVADATRALLAENERTALEARAAEHAAALTATRARLLDLELETVDHAAVTEADLVAAADAAIAADTARAAAIAGETDAQSTAAQLRTLLVRADDAYAEVAAVADEAAVVTRLADTVAGRAPNTMKMELETFVLAAELEEIVAAANLRLADMSSGRYTLLHTDARQARNAASGLGLEVFDAYTGQARTPHSLSGGETFLASLALALGLAQVVTARAGGLRLDTLFIDEGFGSLDADTLELAMDTLDELRQGGRTVGVISHVESMKERLPSQLVVEATPNGPSVIRQDAAAPV